MFRLASLGDQRKLFWVLTAFAIVTLLVISGRVWQFNDGGASGGGYKPNSCPPSAPCVCPPFPTLQPVANTNAAAVCPPQASKEVPQGLCLPPAASGEPLRIAILTATNEGTYQMKLADMTLENKRKYATQHGYDLIVVGSILDKSRIYAWSKILALQRVLPQYHYVMWIDNDAVFTNFSKKIEHQLAAAPSRLDADFFIAKDFNEINAGILFMRCSDWTLDFLQRIWDRTDCVGQVWEEQLAIIKLMKEKEDVRQHSVVLDNAQSFLYQSHFQIWQKGHFVFHNAGCLWMMSEDKCLERLQSYLNQKV